jgi:hypothetical protein
MQHQRAADASCGFLWHSTAVGTAAITPTLAAEAHSSHALRKALVQLLPVGRPGILHRYTMPAAAM